MDGSDRPAAWLDLCARRGLGTSSLERIELVGSTEVVDLDFELPADTLGAPGQGPFAKPVDRWLWRTFGKRRRQAAAAATAWGRLYDDYRSGRLPKEGS